MKWRPEWDLLLGTDTDEAISRRLGVCEKSVNTHRLRCGIKPFSGKLQLPCSGCGRLVKRGFRVAAPACNRCQKKLETKAKAVWRERNREYLRKYDREYLAAHTEKRKQQQQRWIAAHRERWLAQKRRAWKRQHAAIEQIAAELDALCDSCGMHHTPDLRLRILRRMLPCSPADVHEAWPCIWGPVGRAAETDAGQQQLLRDLKKLGAVRFPRSFSYMLQAAA